MKSLKYRINYSVGFDSPDVVIRTVDSYVRAKNIRQARRKAQRLMLQLTRLDAQRNGEQVAHFTVNTVELDSDRARRPHRPVTLRPVGEPITSMQNFIRSVPRDDHDAENMMLDGNLQRSILWRHHQEALIRDRQREIAAKLKSKYPEARTVNTMLQHKLYS